MSDYLTRLAASALEQLDAVQPRLPSRFETTRAAPSVQPDAEYTSDAEAALDRRAAVDPSPPVSPPSRISEQTSEAPRPPARRVVMAPQPETSKPRASRPQDDARKRLTLPAPHPAPQSTDRVIVQSVVSEAAPIVQRPVGTRPPIERAPRSVSPAVVATVVRAPDRVDSASGPSQTTNQERPAIHVTIGRIEVRASLSPAPAAPRAKSTSSAPRLALGDYLRGNSEKRR
jgi:hypothetical protein